MARRLAMLRQECLPDKFTAWEWAVLVASLRNGAGMIEFNAYVAVYQLTERHGVEPIITAYGADPLEVADKLRGLGSVIQIMVCDVVERYWALEGMSDHGQRLEALNVISRAEASRWRTWWKERDQAQPEANRAAKKKDPHA